MKQINKDEVFKEEAMVHFDEIYRVAYRMTRKKEEAEELVQDTFMQAWQSFEKYEPGTNCRAKLKAFSECGNWMVKTVKMSKRYSIFPLTIIG
jgi:RNA polymerase sigma-70 factor (ECF subfamily)